MGEILKYWIENKLGLDLPFFQDPKKFRKAVSNGFLIGEILRKFNVISDDQCVSLRKTLVNKFCVKNMQHLHRWLRDGGLDVDFQDLLAIVQEEPGAAMKFMYRLYLWLESPKSYTIAGFKPLPTLKPQFQESAEGRDVESRCKLAFNPQNTNEFKSWHTLGGAAAAGDAKFLTEPKGNIYYDVPLQPPILLNVRPFSRGAAGEPVEEEPEDLYYDFKAIKSKDYHNQYDDWIQGPKTLCKFPIKSSLKKEQDKVQLEMTRKEELADSLKEMRKFNENALQNPTNNVGQGDGKIYGDGQGNLSDYQKSMKLLKKRKQEEEKLTAERNNYRKGLTSKFVSKIPCQSYSELEADILSRVTAAIPSREEILAEFLTTTHSFKQAFLDHMVFEQAQLSEFKGLDLEKDWDMKEQAELLRRCLQEQDRQLDQRVACQQLIAQEDAVEKNSEGAVQGILSNLLDLVIKVTTYREAAGSDPPEPLMDEWKKTFHAMDNAAEARMADDKPVTESASDLDPLDKLRVNDYVFRTGEWALELPNNNYPDLAENKQLKKIVSYILESLYPPPPTPPPLPSPEFLAAIALSGVNFNWKPSLVQELLVDVAEPFAKLQLLDPTNAVQEAIKAYSNSLARDSGDPQNQSVTKLALNNEETEGEFETLWSQEYGRLGFTSKNEQSQPSAHLQSEEAEVETGRQEKKTHIKKKKEELMANASRSRNDNALNPVQGEKERLRKNFDDENEQQKNHQKDKYDDEDLELDETEEEMSTDQEMTDTANLSKNGPSHDTIFVDENDQDEEEEEEEEQEEDKIKKEDRIVTMGSLNVALHKKRLKKKKKHPHHVQKFDPEYSNTLQIMKENDDDAIAKMEAHGSTQSVVKIPMNLEDQPENWPEFKQLGKLALDQLFRGRPLDDELTAKILVERMRHYSPNSFVVIMNYPQALCQALTLENTVNQYNGVEQHKPPPCYHHADMLIQKYKELRTEEAGPLINMAANMMRTPEIQVKYRSALFKYDDMMNDPRPTAAPDVDESGQNQKLAKFGETGDNNNESIKKSFLDGVIIADVDLSGRLRNPEILNNLDTLQTKMMDLPNRSVEERLAVHLHIAFLQLKKFYADQGIGHSIELGYDDQPYYAVMKQYVQNVADSLRRRKSSYQSADDQSEPRHSADFLDAMHQFNQQHQPFLGEYEGADALLSKLVPPATKSVEVPSQLSQRSEGRPTGESGGGVGGKKGKGKGHHRPKQPHSSGGSKKHAHPPPHGIKEHHKSSETELNSVVGTEKEKQHHHHHKRHGKDKKRKQSKEFAKKFVKEIVQQPPPIDEPVVEDVDPEIKKNDLPLMIVESTKQIVYNIDPKSVSFLGNFWTKMESAYLCGLQNCLGAIRAHHDRVTQYAIDFRTKSSQFLDRPDRKQDLLTQFQEKFNQVSNYIRGDYEVKAELHNRVSELRDRLSAICDEKHDESIGEMHSILSQGFLEGETEILINLFITLIQLEADHFCDVHQFINDFYTMTGLGKPSTIPWRDMLRINLLRKKESPGSNNKSQMMPKMDGLEFFGEDGLLAKMGFDEEAAMRMTASRNKMISSSMQVHPATTVEPSLVSDSQSKSTRSGRKMKRSKKKIKAGSGKRKGQKSNNGNNNNKEKEDEPPSPGNKYGKKKSKKINVEQDNQKIVDEEEEEDEEGQDNEEFIQQKSTSSLENHGDRGLRQNELDINTADMSRPIQDYFGDDEGEEEIKIKNLYQDEIKKNHSQSFVFLEQIMRMVQENISRIESYTANLIKTSVPTTSILTLSEAGQNIQTNDSVSTLKSEIHKKSSKELNPTKKEESTSPRSRKKRSKKSKGQPRNKTSSSPEGKNKKKKSDKSPDSRKKKRDQLLENSIIKTTHTNIISQRDGGGQVKKSGDDISIISSTARLKLIASPETGQSSSGKKVKGSKRTTEWQQAVEQEGKRVKLQLALIEEKAKREIQQLNDILLQVISGGERDAANYYKNEIQNVATICDVFRFAIENGAPIEVLLTLDKRSFQLGQSQSQCTIKIPEVAFKSKNDEEESENETFEGHSEKEEADCEEQVDL